MERLAILLIDDDYPLGQRSAFTRRIRERLSALGVDHLVEVVEISDPPADDAIQLFSAWAEQQVDVHVASYGNRLIAAFVDLCLNSEDFELHEGIQILQDLQNRLPHCRRILISGKIRRGLINQAHAADDFISLSERALALEVQLHESVVAAIEAQEQSSADGDGK